MSHRNRKHNYYYSPTKGPQLHSEVTRQRKAETRGRHKAETELDKALQYALQKEGVAVRSSNSFVREIHERVQSYLANPQNRPTSWEKGFLKSLLRFSVFSQKQLNVLERLVGPLSYNTIPPEIRKATPIAHPLELPARLDANKIMKTCIHCGAEFELTLKKPGKANVCIRCLGDRQ